MNIIPLLSKDDTAVDFAAGCLIAIDKPLDWTSFDVVNKTRYALKRIYPKIKVGHAGTLDPKATGLLLIATGKMTKQAEALQGMDKAYTGTMKLGATTPCFDNELPEDQHFDLTGISDEQIRAAANTLTGNIMQVPPAYSAIKTDGKTAYISARKGQTPELKARPVSIYRFDLPQIHLPYVDFEVDCSKGTYIRSLARDLGEAIQNGAYLTALRRTIIGPYSIDQAWKLEELLSFVAQTAIPHAGTPGT